MRWETKHAKAMKHDGERREVEEFLVFPLTIEGETRWLEKAQYEERYNGWAREWIPVRWINRRNAHWSNSLPA